MMRSERGTNSEKPKELWRETTDCATWTSCIEGKEVDLVAVEGDALILWNELLFEKSEVQRL